MFAHVNSKCKLVWSFFWLTCVGKEFTRMVVVLRFVTGACKAVVVYVRYKRYYQGPTQVSPQPMTLQFITWFKAENFPINKKAVSILRIYSYFHPNNHDLHSIHDHNIGLQPSYHWSDRELPPHCLILSLIINCIFC